MFKQNQNLPDHKGNSDEPETGREVMSFCINLLRIAGLTPIYERNPIIAHAHNFFIFALLMTSTILQIVGLIECWGDFKPMCFISGTLSGCSAITVNYILLIKNRDAIFKVIHVLKIEYISRVNPKYMGYVRNSEKEVVKSAILKILFGTALTGLGTIIPLINKSIDDGGSVTGNLTKYQYMTKYQIFVTYTPLDIQQSPQFELNYVVLVILTAFVVGTDAVIDSLYYALLSHLTAQFKILVAVLDDMDENLNFIDNEESINYSKTTSKKCEVKQRYSTDISKEEMDSIQLNEVSNVYPDGKDIHKAYLKDCIRRHQALLSFSDDLNSMMSFAAFLQVISTPVMICMGGFLMTTSLTVFTDVIKYSSLVALAFYKLLIYCMYAEDLTQASLKVREALYNLNWYGLSMQCQRMLPIMIIRSADAVVPKASVFYELSMDSFGTVLNTAYTYFTLLLQMSDS
ncbi:Odorant receptor 39 [Blattella germanica]|nr:Odorant receptor 39 [Blattella germanica]